MRGRAASGPRRLAFGLTPGLPSPATATATVWPDFCKFPWGFPSPCPACAPHCPQHRSRSPLGLGASGSPRTGRTPRPGTRDSHPPWPLVHLTVPFRACKHFPEQPLLLGMCCPMPHSEASSTPTEDTMAASRLHGLPPSVPLPALTLLVLLALDPAGSVWSVPLGQGGNLSGHL